ncbi:NEDD8-conjugating protein ubc12 [Ascosphaera pollenicola]|nr:NEDD8-conjugating protein ubc12 [Ascosphaera pollenicola]
MSRDGEQQPAILLSSTSPAAATTTLATASSDAANINIPPPTTDPATLSKKRGAEELSLAEEPRSGIPPLGDATNGATFLPRRTQLIDLAVRSGSPVKKQSAAMPLNTGNGKELEGGMHVDVDVDVDGEGAGDAAISPSGSSPQDPAAAATATGASTTTTSITPETQARPPKKKQKLSPTSKEAKEKERKLREQQKAEEKARRDEERRKHEEERKQREEAREQKRRAKEEERLARDEEKKRREKSQMRLNAFFAKPKVSAQEHREHSSSSKPEVASTTKAEESKPATDYELEFRPFFLQSHTTILPIHRFQRDEFTTKQALDNLDSALSKQSSSSASSLSPPDNSISKPACRILAMKPRSRQLHNARKHSVKEILHMLYHPTSWRTELANTPQLEPSVNPEHLIKQIPMKTLQFAEDVRPPYQGTFTRPISPRDAASLARNPFRRAIPGINYDYDSEAEWDDPEEGEDLDSDDGDEEQQYAQQRSRCKHV